MEMVEARPTLPGSVQTLYNAAIAQAKALHLEAGGLIESIEEKRKRLLRNRFKLGKIAEAVANLGMLAGERGAISAFAEDTGISHDILRQSRRFYTYLQRDEERLEEWITSRDEQRLSWAAAFEEIVRHGREMKAQAIEEQNARLLEENPQWTNHQVIKVPRKKINGTKRTVFLICPHCQAEFHEKEATKVRRKK